MNKQEFIANLQAKLSGLPKQDVEDRLSFYSEMIDDRIEEGLSEKEAILEIGSVDEIASQIVADIPLTKIVREKIKTKRQLKAWEIVLLVLGSPIWLSLLISAFAVVLSLYVTLWSLIASIWAVFASLIACGLSGVVAGFGYAIFGNSLSGIAIIGAGLTSAGLAILLFFGCIASTKGTILLTKKIVLGIKKCFIKKEATK